VPIRLRWPPEIRFNLNAIPLIVIAGLDPVIPVDAGAVGITRSSPAMTGR
jgi:hypothetical protein